MCSYHGHAMVLSLLGTHPHSNDPRREESSGLISLNSCAREDMCTQDSQSSARGIRIGRMKSISLMVLTRTLRMVAAQSLGECFVQHDHSHQSSDLSRIVG